jgi:prolyl-tRNA synthetase
MGKKEGKEGLSLKYKKSQFSEWYNQVIQLTGILDKRYGSKSFFVWMNYGYEIMLSIKKYWDRIFKEAGIKEMYFPLLVPVKYCEKNPDWWNGFKEQAFWVKGSGEKNWDHILRPTGEPAMYPMFSIWIRSYNDLPFRIYENVSSFRYETKHTRPMIRDREITLWHEIHTAHATKSDAEKEVKLHVKLYDMIWEKCALYPLRVNKPKWEIFPGAVGAIEYYNLMPSGKVLENGSINNLGQAYSKKFDIKFIDKDGKKKYVWQVCTGNGARLLAAVIGVHGDDKGLIIPPEIAPIQIIIVPIYNNKTKNMVVKKSKDLHDRLSKEFKVEIDLRDDVTPGSKFYDWELRGVPLRVEIGPKEMESKCVTVVRRDTGEKSIVKEGEILKKLKEILSDIQDNLLKRAKKMLESSIKTAKNKKEIRNVLDKKSIAKVYWCGSGECWDKIKEMGEGIELFGTDLKKATFGKCIICKKKTDTIGYVANTY